MNGRQAFLRSLALVLYMLMCFGAFAWLGVGRGIAP